MKNLTEQCCERILKNQTGSESNLCRRALTRPYSQMQNPITDDDSGRVGVKAHKQEDNPSLEVYSPAKLHEDYWALFGVRA